MSLVSVPGTRDKTRSSKKTDVLAASVSVYRDTPCLQTTVFGPDTASVRQGSPSPEDVSDDPAILMAFFPDHKYLLTGSLISLDNSGHGFKIKIE